MAECNEEISIKNCFCGHCENREAIGYCKDCQEFVCSEFKAMHQRIKAMRDHEITDLKPTVEAKGSQLQTCPVHDGVAINTYCETCEEFICGECASQHNAHSYVNVQEAYPKNKIEITQALRPLKQCLEEVKKVLVDFEANKKEIVQRCNEAEGKVSAEIDQIKQLLDQLKVKTVTELQKSAGEKLKALEGEERTLKASEKKILGCLNEMAKQTQSVKAVVTKKECILEEVVNCLAQNKIELKLESGSDWQIKIPLDDLSSFKQACPESLKFEVLDSKTLFSMENSFVDESCLVGLTVGSSKSVLFHLRSKTDEPISTKLKLKAELVHCSSQYKQACGFVEPNANTPYQYTFNIPKLSKVGKHMLFITIEDEQIKGSPFLFTPSFSDYTEYTWSGEQKRQVCPTRSSSLSEPSAVTINSKGQVVLIEGDGSCISILDEKLVKLSTFGSFGSGNGQFNKACGITTDHDDNIYVVDENIGRIQKFSHNGTYITHTKASISTVCYNYVDKLIYASGKISKTSIYKYSLNLKVISSFALPLKNPTGLAFDSSNNLYVSDSSDHCIYVFTADGKSLRSFSLKIHHQKLHSPGAIAIDSVDNVYVAEGEKQEYVSIFNSKGAFVYSLYDKDYRKNGVAVDKNDQLFVTTHNSLLLY